MVYLDSMFGLGCCIALSVWKMTTGIPARSHIVVSEGFTVAVMEEIQMAEEKEEDRKRT